MLWLQGDNRTRHIHQHLCKDEELINPIILVLSIQSTVQTQIKAIQVTCDYGYKLFTLLSTTGAFSKPFSDGFVRNSQNAIFLG